MANSGINPQLGPSARYQRTSELGWGLFADVVIRVGGTVPGGEPDALEYMKFDAGSPLAGEPVDVVFIGSCTNSRIEDLRQAAAILEGRKKADHVELLVVPGSDQIRQQAQAEGLDKIFKAAGAQWRYAGCSMCLGMNPDQLRPQQRSASTSNRNFEGRQGKGGRTHLVSPEMAAAAAVSGKFVDIRKWPQ